MNLYIRIGKYKLQKFTRAYYINVPKMWIENKNLDKGSELEIWIDENGNLVLKPVVEAEIQ